MLWQRVVTALLLLPLVLGAIFFLPNPLFAAFIAVPVLVAGDEWTRMAPVCNRTFMVLLAMSLVVVFGAMSLAPGAAVPLLWAAALAWPLGLYLVLRYPALDAWARNRALMYFVGLLLLLPAWYAVVHVQGMRHGGWLLLGGLVMVWAADVGAYFAGRALGRRKLAVHVSPGKSVEGAVGGLLLALAVAAAVCAWLALPTTTTLQVLALTLVVTLASILGDLFESMAKRIAGVKDSGTLLPGHGGVLDRIDSITCAMPFYAIGVAWIRF